MIMVHCNRCDAVPAGIGVTTGDGRTLLQIHCHGDVATYDLALIDFKPAAGAADTPPPGDGPACHLCGAASVRTGTCLTCQSCGETTGCG